MCQAVEENGLSCKCYAIDTWRGDLQTGIYDESVFDDVKSHNEQHYSAFSQLVRMTFDEAIPQFGLETIDVLHIDGLHTYEAVRHDFSSWLPKVRAGGVVLLHDTAARHADFAVWKLWDELCRQFLHLEFRHSWGLGVLQKPGLASDIDPLRNLFASSVEEQDFLRHYYSSQAELLERRHAATNHAGAVPYTYLQVYPHLTDGVDEATSVVTPVDEGEWRHIIVNLPQGSGHGRIRVDPANRPCVIHVAAIALKRAIDGSMIKDWSTLEGLAELLPIGDLVNIRQSDTLTFLSTGHDPRLLLPDVEGRATDQPLLLEMRIRIDSDLGGAVAALAEQGAEVRQLQAERAALDADVRQLRDTNEALTSRIASLENFLATNQTKLSAVEEQLNSMSRGRQALAEELETLRLETLRLARENAQLAQDLKVICGSRSWRLTAPLRRLLQTIR
jgi:hypothetical protein